jgi:predicted metal-dependent HD superfamily phosphohydrolase
LLTCRHAPLALPPALAVEILARYGETHRAYHDAAHISEVLGWFDTIQEGPRGGWRKPKEVYAAILFHDIIYVPGAKDNELRSAELARTHAAELGVDADRVAYLIELTARHGGLVPADVAGDPDAGMFLDADMAIVAAAPAKFDAYDAGIRFEYDAVPEDAYRAGRRAFLAGLLGKPRIFLTELFHGHLDAQARENLERAVARLT